AWFNSPWLAKKLHPGSQIIVAGKATRHGDYLQMVNPKWQPVDPTGKQFTTERAELAEGNTNQSFSARSASSVVNPKLIPIYPATESLPSHVIQQTIDSILDQSLALLEDHLPADFRRKAALISLADAYRLIHRPQNEEDAARARRRLAFDELFMLQLGVMLKRAHRRQTLHAPQLKHGAKISQRIRARLPVKAITPDQARVINEIVGDLEKTTPMNRLLQGDVGSGKTLVALYAMLMAVASKHQTALMAPTEMLAEQHFGLIRELLRDADVSIELLTGSLKPAQRRQILAKLESGEIDILIGTHALLTESVNFKSLALAVIDEQHRFGVHQRATLRAKSTDPKSTPHMLVMTATPIPRTLSLTVFGDLDISTIKGLPPGRQPVITKHVSQAKSLEVYEYVAKRLKGGEQAYIVVPVIDESATQLKSLKAHFDWLTKGPLSAFKAETAAMHGRVDRAERESIMERFRAGKIKALVATTVIEVGVDVPNASIMVIEQAERFGLAQLHQLRGRVGRGSRRALCVLIADPQTEDAKARIAAVVGSTDGFVIAEKDMEIRGPGELFGARQSGLPPFKVADLPGDMALLRMARREAEAWVERNPTLAGPDDALLRKRLMKVHGKAMGLADVA
ncbi:MAG: ATP-dependent DNA helicase RecG, partial [Phycisphaerales bacterium]|nr:ATP-dependent DNA helicase RecG [Phycisphaerales bacterium]